MASKHRGELSEFLQSRPLLVFDYDGTLCPIVDYASQARLSASTKKLLKTLCGRVPCVLLSGRARADVLTRVRGIPFVEVVGSHGEDWSTPRRGDTGHRKRAALWFDQLQARLGELEGVEIENKGLSLSVHYRSAPSHARASHQITKVLEALHGMRVIGGKAVFNILPEESGGKGSSLRELKKIFKKPTAVYLGDDLTDEEVFILPKKDRVFKIRIGRSGDSAADYFIPRQEQIDDLLEFMVDHLPQAGAL